MSDNTKQLSKLGLVAGSEFAHEETLDAFINFLIAEKTCRQRQKTASINYEPGKDNDSGDLAR